MEMIKLILTGLFVITRSSSFEIVSHSVKKSPVQEGGTVELNCNVDGPFEWCTFRRHDGKVCDFEWKRKSWLVEVVDCKDFKERFAITGSYDKNECGLKLSNVSPLDAGNWTCELESYHFGQYRGYGYKDQKVLVVKVVDKVIDLGETPTSTQEAREGEIADNIDSSRNYSLSDIIVIVNVVLILVIGLVGFIFFFLTWKKNADRIKNQNCFSSCSG